MSFAWQVHDSTGVREYLIVELPPKFPVLDYEDETRRDRLQLFQSKNWGWWVFASVAVIVIACVVCGRGFNW